MIECPECGSSVRGKKCVCGYIVKTSSVANGVKSVGCAAHGCPMPGSISRSIFSNENSEWLCRFHFGEPVDQWGKITNSIRSGAAMKAEEVAKKEHGEYLRKLYGVKEQ